MRVNCTIDGIKYSINASSDKPLHRILLDFSESFAANSSCKGAECGNCVVLMDGQCVLSCLIPACRLEGSVITTFEEFRKTDACHDIEKAYDTLGSSPCPQCYASKTLLIEGLVERLEKIQSSTVISGKRNVSKTRNTLTSEFIKRELSINSCSCMELSNIEAAVKLAYQYRRRRSG